MIVWVTHDIAYHEFYVVLSETNKAAGPKAVWQGGACEYQKNKKEVFNRQRLFSSSRAG